MVTPTSEAKNNPMAAKITQDYLASSSVFAQIFFNDILSTTTNYERKSPSNLLELHSKNNLVQFSFFPRPSHPLSFKGNEAFERHFCSNAMNRTLGPDIGNNLENSWLQRQHK